MKKVVLYARVSTVNHGQTVENQLLVLREVCARNGWTIVKEITDQVSGAKGRDGRPGFDELFTMVHRRDCDLVAAWSIDRLGRSLSALIAFMNELSATRIDLYVHQQAVNTTTPAGRMVFSIFGAIGEFERELCRDRIRAGLVRAKSQGKRLGRPTNVTEGVKQTVKTLRHEGWSLHRIARELKIGVGTTSRILSAAV
ncbi:MAG: hypothetical protein RL768_2891 [Nitrospirota bacterium]|jgi:DNA invertase Pin-like site-specific DNA recombinase